MDNALRTQIDTYNEHAGAPVEAIAFPPTLTDKEETWTGWIRDIKKYWHDAIQFMQAERESIKRTKIKEAIDSRCDQMRGNPGKMLDSILDRHRGKVVIDRVQQTINGNVVSVKEGDQVKDTVKRHFNEWHGRREVQPLDDHPRWKAQYEPKEWIDPTWYNGLMDPPSMEELLAALKESPKAKAAGISGVANDLFLKQGGVGDYILFQLICACLLQEDVPFEWKTGIVYCIPKATEWSGSLADVRPITLLEHGRKLLFSIITSRLSAILSKHDILKGPNFSVLKGTTTKDPIYVLQATLEDAREFKKE
ncbi:hypothetical protein BC939DRAFT_172928 [Gamsiella multidivaricata]|uniref:uncharacterized protein n=1 Tax=Gamsiella multidivaricata TaxID=101098 RepID=UPI0022207A8C|nr:uncharacterized protein BC939DRAFT_172928 [Gamsiella multidivaricata]KAI7822883.1 hypothetical protein BC939DRAFT_172928 [Gamsiella multidivaricata]